MRTHKRKLIWLFTGKASVRLLAVFFMLLSANPVLGIVFHPDGEPNLAIWTDRPDPNVVGRWSNNASCVAVSSNCVITTRHQGGGIDTPVEIAGETYLVSQIWNHSTADIRVARLYSANLTSFVSRYTNTDEINKSIVIGGFGKQRDPTDTTNPFAWTTETNNNSNPLLLGTNDIDGIDTSSYASEVLVSHFNLASASTYECTIAEFDSGGGWFIKDGTIWKVAGLNRGLKVFDESWYTSALNRNYLDAVRVSTYAGWIDSTIPEPWPGDLTGDDWVDFYDFAVFGQYWQRTDCNEPDWCAGADSEPDGDIDWDDLLILRDNWLTGL